jgi:hypothetical protein
MTSDLPRNARVGYEQLVNRRPSIVQSNRQRSQIRFITMYHLAINSISYWDWNCFLKMCIPIQYLHHEYRRRDRWAWVLPDTDIWVRVECRWKRKLAVEVERQGKKRGTRPDHQQTFLQLAGDEQSLVTCWLCESHESWFNRKERWAGQSQGQPTKFASLLHSILRKILSPPYSEYARRVRVYVQELN